MKKLIPIIVMMLLITLSGCSGSSGNKLNYDVVSNTVTIWEDPTGEYNIILVYEVSNLIGDPLYFKESDFDIVDENGTLIDSMKAVSAYPSAVKPDKTAVYYDKKLSDKISDANTKLKAIPHIESEKTRIKRSALSIVGLESGGSLYSIGTVKNNSSHTEYSNVHFAVIARTASDEVVSVMTATINMIEPGEKIEVKAEDCLKQRDLGPDIVTKYQPFVYLDP